MSLDNAGGKIAAGLSDTLQRGGDQETSSKTGAGAPGGQERSPRATETGNGRSNIAIVDPHLHDSAHAFPHTAQHPRKHLKRPYANVPADGHIPQANIGASSPQWVHQQAQTKANMIVGVDRRRAVER